MIKTTYKRKGCNYLVRTKKRTHGFVKIINLLSRGVYRSGVMTLSLDCIYVSVFNAVGQLVAAEFSANEENLAKRFIYKTMNSRSPQFSLFGDGI